MKLGAQLLLCVLIVLVYSVSALAQAPLPPQNLTVLAGEHGGTLLRWESGGDGMGYKVYKSVDGQPFNLIETLERREFLDWWVFPGHSYAFYVTAFNNMGESDPSNTVEFSFDHPPVPPVHGAVTGTVVDDLSGLPVRDAVVNFYRLNGLWNVRTHTDTGGAYSMALDPGNYIMRTEKMGYKGEWFDDVRRVDSAFVLDIHHDSTITANVGLEPLQRPAPSTVTGTVTDSVSGNPLPNAFVAFIRPYRFFRELEIATGLFCGLPEERFAIPGFGLLHGVLWAGLTDSAGNYTAHIPPGVRCIALAFKPGYVVEFFNNKRTPLEADRLFFAHDTSGIDFPLHLNSFATATISGTVVDSAGNGIPSHLILVRRAGFLHLSVRFAVTDSLGNYAFSHVSPGVYLVKAIPLDGFAPAWYSAANCGVRNWHNADTLHVASDVSGINVCVVPWLTNGFASIGGQVTENAGGWMIAKANHPMAATPSEGATVYAVATGSGVVFGSDITEDDGTYSIENLPPGTYDVVVDKEGFSVASTSAVTVDASNNYAVTDNSLIVNPDGTTSVGGGAQPSLPAAYRLEQNYPNPFNPTTEIRFDLPTASTVTLRVYNLIGQQVTELANTVFEAGSHHVQWNAGDNTAESVGSGIYFVKLVASPIDGSRGTFTQVRKMILLR